MSILLRVDGVDYEDFTAISVNSSMADFCNVAEFTFTDRNRDGLRFDGSEFIEIIIDSELYFSGYAGDFEGSISSNDHTLNLVVYQKTIDIAQSSLTDNIEVVKGATIEYIIQKVIENIGIDCKVVTDLTIEPFQEDEIVSGVMGENAFDFIDQYIKKRQVLLNTNKDGNIEIVRSNTVYNGDILQLIDGNETNNVIISSFSKNFNKKFYKYTCKCQDNLTNGNLNKDFENRVAITYDNSVRKTRQLEIIIDSSSIDTLKKRVIWEKNVRQNSGVYNCIVKGHRSSAGNLWEKNMLVSVKDDTWGIEKQMIIKELSLKEDLSSGLITEMNCVDPITFSTVEDYDYNFEEGTLTRK